MSAFQTTTLPVPLNEPTYQRVKRAIIGDLMRGDFNPGTHLTIDALTARYGVSHMPIREALRQLEGEGILVSLAHKGFRIEAISESYIRNIYDIALASNRCLPGAPSSEQPSRMSWKSANSMAI
ncbi:GntR family transcriptional regulator [Aureimonas altamirensis]|uniref:GntR family transcriptional regulator n=1 Tax=Aureimonas altamirensis TaxID=370622 RepID=UPI002552D9EA|nr:GntR family transcriptional regulator [Aureimonas altamirensis]